MYLSPPVGLADYGVTISEMFGPLIGQLKKLYNMPSSMIGVLWDGHCFYANQFLFAVGL